MKNKNRVRKNLWYRELARYVCLYEFLRNTQVYIIVFKFSVSFYDAE